MEMAALVVAMRRIAETAAVARVAVVVAAGTGMP
jgi:hypothetical protein